MKTVLRIAGVVTAAGMFFASLSVLAGGKGFGGHGASWFSGGRGSFAPAARHTFYHFPMQTQPMYPKTHIPFHPKAHPHHFPKVHPGKLSNHNHNYHGISGKQPTKKESVSPFLGKLPNANKPLYPVPIPNPNPRGPAAIGKHPPDPMYPPDPMLPPDPFFPPDPM